jgi:dTDP-4-dehydrorhamnose 3,5-epimerase-like enzyme
MSKIYKPQVLELNSSLDDRGIVSFSNDLNISNYKRFYTVKNHKNNFVRAWHGHKFEQKALWVLRGSFMICLVKISDWSKPNKKSKVNKYFISENQNKVIKIPSGYANGFMNLTKDSELIFLSNKSLQSSLKDDYRYPFDYWNPWEIIQR